MLYARHHGIGTSDTFLRGGVGLRLRPERALERLLTIGHASGGACRRGQPASAALVRHSAVSEADLRKGVALALATSGDSAAGQAVRPIDVYI